MNDEDMQRLRKLMWDVYTPSMKKSLENKLAVDGDQTTTSFQAQMYVVHLSVRVAQALQLVFELNQKKSFSAVAKTAYGVALQDVLYHPHVKGRVTSFEYGKLINYLRRHPTFSTAFNTYVGYKLLRQQLVRCGGAGTNRKSNDAERLHDEAANRLWSVLDENTSICRNFRNAPEPYTMDWHHMYYKEVAETLYHKLADYSTQSSEATVHMNTNENHKKNRKEMADIITANRDEQDNNTQEPATTNMGIYTSVNVVSAMQESRDTVAGGTSKRVEGGCKGPKYNTATLTTVTSTGGRGSIDTAATKRQRGGGGVVHSTPHGTSHDTSHGSAESPSVSPHGMRNRTGDPSDESSAGGRTSLGGGGGVETDNDAGMAGGDRMRRAYAALFQ